jgi:hypothetical protein
MLHVSSSVVPVLSDPVEEHATGVPLCSVMLQLAVPVGKPEPGDSAVMAAVNVTGWPEVSGSADEVMAMAALAWSMDWESGLALDPLKTVEPS